MESYVSDVEAETSVEDQPPKARAKKRTRKWVIGEIFDVENDAAASREAALKFVHDSGHWAFHYGNDLKKGRKEYYRCQDAKRRGPQCDAAIYLYYPDTVPTVTVFKTESDHNHGDLASKVSLSKEDKAKIMELYEAGDDSKRIWEGHGKKVLKNRRQLTNILVNLRTQKYGSTEISVEDLRQWCADRGNIPDDENTLFVLDTQIEDDGSIVRVLVSTTKLLKMSAKSNIVHADGTYKLMWQGFPLIVVGTTDARRKFVLTAFAICTGEKDADYKFVFQGLKQAYQVLNIACEFK